MTQPTKPPTILEIVQLLPFSKGFQDKIRSVYPDQLDGDRRNELERVLWRAYYLYFDMVYQENLQLLIERTENSLPTGYHDILINETTEQIQRGITTQQTSTQIDVVREELEKLVTN